MHNIIDFSNYLYKANTSYKFFLLYFLFDKINYKKRDFTFRELSCGIIAYSWKTLNEHNAPLNKNDKLFDLMVSAYSNFSDLTPYSSNNEVYDYFYNCNISSINKKIYSLGLYAPYRLLVDNNLSKIIKNADDWKKNKLISDYSKNNNDCFYLIDHDTIIINTDYIEYISCNRNQLLLWIQNKILERFSI